MSINGSNNLCDVIQRTYTLDPSNLTNIQWSGSNIQFLSSNNQEARVRKINSTLSASITATCTSGGGNVQAYKFLTCNRPNLRFALNYENNLNIKVKLADMINEMPLINQNITNVQWDITSGNGQLLDYNNTEAVINGTNFTGVVTATNDEGETYTRNFFWPDPNSCKAITKIGFDKYQVINRCDNNSIVEEVSAKEIYNMMGYKIGDLPLSTDEININTGNTGDIQLIHIISEGENLTKRIVKD